MKLFFSGALATLCLMFGIASLAAFGQTDTTTSDYGTLVCRVALNGETPNAKLMSQTTVLRCKTVSPQMSMKNIATVQAKEPATMGPDFSKALTPQQVNDAWKKYVDHVFYVDHSP